MAVFVSKKNAYSGEFPSFYVGRPSPLGNPFSIEDYGREKCLELYREYLTENVNEPAIAAHLRLLRGASVRSDIVLLCWCRDDFNPRSRKLKCHAEIIKEFI